MIKNTPHCRVRLLSLQNGATKIIFSLLKIFTPTLIKKKYRLILVFLSGDAHCIQIKF